MLLWVHAAALPLPLCLPSPPLPFAHQVLSTIKSKQVTAAVLQEILSYVKSLAAAGLLDTREVDHLHAAVLVGGRDGMGWMGLDGLGWDGMGWEGRSGFTSGSFSRQCFFVPVALLHVLQPVLSPHPLSPPASPHRPT